jgi:hypothetical protein
VWWVRVTLTGPDKPSEIPGLPPLHNYGVDKINVGGIQHVSILKWRSQYSTNPNTTLAEVADGKKDLLDSVILFRPWFNPSTLKGKPFTQTTGLVAADDSPRFGVPRSFMGKLVNQVELEDGFDLYIASTTTSSPGLDVNKDQYFHVTTAAQWTFNANGTLKLAANGVDTDWTPGKDSGIKLPKDKTWQMVTKVEPELQAVIKGPLANDVANPGGTLSFTPKKQ